MATARAFFFAAILSIWVTTEAFQPNSWIPESFKKGNDQEVIFSKKGNSSGLVIPRSGNSSGMVIPRSGNETGMVIPRNTLGCGRHTLAPGESVTIQSLNYPSNYPRNYKCKWKFRASSSSSIVSISCSTFQLESCRQSFVKIKGGAMRAKECGSQNGLFEMSTTNRMDILFRTKRNSRTAQGFRCTVSASGTAPPTTPPTNPPATTPSPSGCQSCGTVNRDTRIVGGEVTEVNEYPWQVALVYAGTSTVFCGGSVYNDRYIITAAHCGEAIEYYDIDTEVLLGAHNVNNPSGVQRIAVTEIINHEDYDNSNLDNDIALLRLASAATLNERVKPACLPDPSNDYDDVNAIVSGWGTTSEGGSQPNTLMEVEVPTMSNANCQNSYGSGITANMLCAGFAAGGRDSCQGDSGGPLATYENGRWVLIGVVSWGYGCARPRYPGVYARVTRYLNWLATNAASGQNNLCPTGSSVVSSSATTTSTSAPSPPSTGCKCGHRNTVSRIVGGNPTDIHEYPWQVALVRPGSTTPFCGGSIISDQWILTAAHCIDGRSTRNTRVVIGEHDHTSNSETTVTATRRISQIIEHEYYNPNTVDNDMALLKLTDPITFSSDNKIAPVCLPPAGNLYESVNAIVTGWGTLTSGGRQPDELYEVTVPTMSNTQCRQTEYSSNDITNNMICAGLPNGGKDSCQGDSGGPMVTAGNSAQTFFIQIGVVSWGYGCALRNAPGVYARVNNYLSWISTNTAGSFNTCPSS